MPTIHYPHPPYRIGDRDVPSPNPLEPILRRFIDLLMPDSLREQLQASLGAAYTIERELGRGGLATVFLARDVKHHRHVALKVLNPELAASLGTERFLAEISVTANLQHPNVLPLFDSGETNGLLFYVMPFVAGESLRAKLDREGQLPVDEAVRIASAIAFALDYAHRHGVVHRDVKPENVLLSDGVPMVADFGIAKAVSSSRLDGASTNPGLTKAGHWIGTPSYMSPEQAMSEAVDGRSDIYALGCMLYEMLSGHVPFIGPSAQSVLTQHLVTAIPSVRHARDSVPLSVDATIVRAMAKEPADRFANPAQFAAALVSAPHVEPMPDYSRLASVAVLPFANMSADKENEFFGDGLAEEIINVLAQVPGMKVAGRTSSFFFRGKDVEFGELGRRLNVDHILEGSVRKAGNHIRVTAQLIKVTDGFHLWSERYDREMTDIFEIQDEITQAIAAALRIKLSPEAATFRRQTPNLRAYAAYLEARDHWVRPTPESLARVKECLEHAIELDPKFALAYSLLGAHYTMLANLGFRPAREVIPLARAAEQAALRIEPSLPEAHALLGVCAGTDYNWNEAEREWRLAMAQEPVSRDVRFWYGNHYLLSMGRLVEAVEAMARGLQDDPLNVLYRHHFAVGLRNAGRLEDAEAELRKILEIDENFPLAVSTLGAICAQQGRFEEALTLTERAYALTPWRHPVIGQLAALLVRAGARSRADALLEMLGAGKEYGAPTGLAVFHAVCGDLDRAAEWAERAIEERYPRLVPILGPLLRSSPRWPALAKLMNLPG
jgi:eukaryotic-like serine/threonine-protein kinase